MLSSPYVDQSYVDQTHLSCKRTLIVSSFFVGMASIFITSFVKSCRDRQDRSPSRRQGVKATQTACMPLLVVL